MAYLYLSAIDFDCIILDFPVSNTTVLEHVECSVYMHIFVGVLAVFSTPRCRCVVNVKCKCKCKTWFSVPIAFAASRGVDVEKVSSPVATPTTFTTAATTSACVAVVAMMLLLSATMFMYRRSTLLKRFFKGLHAHTL